MTQFRDPWLPRRLAAQADIADGERRIREAVVFAMTEYLKAARLAILGEVVDGHLVAAPSDQQPPNISLWPGLSVWRQLLASFVVPVIGKLWGERFKAAARNADVSDEPFRVSYLERVIDRLVLWQANAFEEIRLELLEGLESSETIPQQRDRIARVLNIDARSRELQADINAIERELEDPNLDPSQRADLRAQRADLYGRKDDEDKLWMWQANRIARTEVMGAYNGGSFDGASAYSADAGEPLFKQWLATEDTRTRDTHVDADGQVQPLAQPFIVGGFPLMNPGDPVGPPQEVIQCRCSLLVIEPEDAEGLQSSYAEKVAGLPPERAALLTVTAGAALCECDREKEREMGEDMQSRLTGPLRDYWVRGEGAARIRWGQPGDFNRCVRLLAEHYPTNPEGLCANLHHEALGKWPGEESGMSVDIYDQAQRAEMPVGVPDPSMPSEDKPLPVGWYGTLAPLGVKSGDGRVLADVPLRTRELPLVFSAQEALSEGHQGAVTVGAIDHVWVENGVVKGMGRFDLGSEYGREVARKLSEGFERWVSVDIDDVVAESAVMGADGELIDRPDNLDDLLEWEAPEGASFIDYYTDYRIIGATFVAHPAFAEAVIKPIYPGQLLIAAATNDVELPDGPPALVAAAPAWAPPAEWFEAPELAGPTPITISADGYVFGHLATWDTCHIGFPGSCVKPPRTRTEYAHFHVGSVLTADGSEISVGKLTVGGGHADARSGFRAATQHYDDTGAAVAVVRAHEDRFGIVVSGAVLNSASEEQLSTLRRSPLSGDWRNVGGNLELVAALCVNVPGFPVPRVVTASAEGRDHSLVAAGMIIPRKPTTFKVVAGEGLQLDRGAFSFDVKEIAREVVREMQNEERRTEVRDILDQAVFAGVRVDAAKHALDLISGGSKREGE